MTSPRRQRTHAVVHVAQLVPQQNRTRFQVYALEYTDDHDGFLSALWQRLPGAATRAQVRAAVAAVGDGRYAVRGDAIVAAAGEATRRRLFASPARRSRARSRRRAR